MAERKIRSAVLVLIILACAGGAAGGALASQVYKSVEPDGSVAYGDAPVPGARSVERLKPVPPAQAASLPASPAEAELVESFRARHARLEAAHERVLAARAALAEAELGRARAEEPLPGERLGNANGTSRLTPAYFERLAEQDRRVAEARASLSAALQELHEAR